VAAINFLNNPDGDKLGKLNKHLALNFYFRSIKI
jgi:hypothetical protein